MDLRCELRKLHERLRSFKGRLSQTSGYRSRVSDSELAVVSIVSFATQTIITRAWLIIPRFTPDALEAIEIRRSLGVHKAS
jgi:hypothetical protein